ncbi:MAG TPA: DNRLRE domain-containing protein [Saprospiraceae bacterium]|nr:DNRLRE domain-containing protein [Saprospiraceae bacterium]
MKTLSSFFFVLCSVHLFSQTAIDLQPGPAEGNDAWIFNMDALANHGSDVDLLASQLDYSGEPGTIRSVFKFNLPTLPKEAHVVDARLSLYYNHESQTPGQLGDNAAVLRRLIVPWEESTVVWAQQPAYTTENEVLIPASSFPDQDYLDINVTELVKDMFEFPSTSHGFILMLQDETGVGKAMKFYSSDAAIADKRPRLVIVYSTMSATNDVRAIPVAVSPNPFQQSFSVEGIEGNYTLTITDINGQVMHHEKGDNTDSFLEIDQLDKLTPGFYYITVINNEKVLTGKAIKTN